MHKHPAKLHVSDQSLSVANADGLILCKDHDGVLVIEMLQSRITDPEVIPRIERALQAAFDATGASRVVIDFRNVKFLSSAVLGVVVGLGILVRESSGILALSNVAPNLQKVFTITSIDKMIRIYESVDDAIVAIGQKD